MTTSGDSIQIDKGEFVRVHNAIFDLLAKAPLRGQQFRCLMFLFRKTYGFNKKEDKISLKEWADGTGLQRQNVWRELRLLLKCNVIYMIANGEKRANTWGFNKRHEQWNFQSVITDNDSSVVVDDDKPEQSVIVEDYRLEQSVITSDYKSVITPSHTRELKDSKDKLAATPCVDDDNDAVTALVSLAYSSVGKVSPAFSGENGRANLMMAAELVDRFGFPSCTRGISTMKERNNARIQKNVRDGIRSPIGYLRTIMEDEHAMPVTVLRAATVDFALEEVL